MSVHNDRRGDQAVPETNAEVLAARRKNARGERTRRRLVDAAAECFAEYGYGQTRVSDIVFRAGVSQGNFYRHFASKKDVFLEALEPAAAELLDSSGPDGLGDTRDLPGLIELTAAFLSSYARNRRLLRTMREAAAAHAEDGLVDVWLAQRTVFVQRTRRWLERLFAAGRIGDGDRELLAEALTSAVEQLAYVHIGLARQTPRPERLRELAVVLAEVWHRALPPLPASDHLLESIVSHTTHPGIEGDLPMNESSPRLLVLHALRLSGFLSPDKIAARTGLDEATVSAELTAARGEEQVKERTGRISGWMLTPVGRARHAELLAEELAASDAREAVEQADQGFVEINEPFKALCTRWQIKGDPAGGTPNDHTDAGYDGQVISDLAALHPKVVAVTGELAGALPRFGRYPRAFEAALARLQAGETAAFAKPMAESYHDVWMELHQDLMSTLGRERSAADGH